MAENKTDNDRLREITESIERGIGELFESEKYAQYLRTMSRFHAYSINNTVLINMQRPDATLVAGYNKWKDQFERHVKRGEVGIRIIAPTPYQKRIEEMKLDPDTKAPILDTEGNPVVEEKVIQIPRYRAVAVFDVSQTDGKPLPVLASNLTGDVQQYEDFMEALRRASPVPIEIAPIESGADGTFSLEHQRIVLREGMSQVQTISAAVHEIAHASLHNRNPLDEEEYQSVELFGIPALFSNGRINAEALPDGIYRYELRGSDDDPGLPIRVENHVVVNHAATILINQELDLGENGARNLSEEDGLNFTGDTQTLASYRESPVKDRRTMEVEAESVSYAVCQYYGIETSENSFGYIAEWSKNKELPELRASLETIRQASSKLISNIDRHMAQICKEHEAEKSAYPLEQMDEHLLDVNNTTYLHIQKCDDGYDYTLFDKESLRELDGGQLDNAELTVPEVCAQICEMHELKATSIQPVALSVLDSLHDAAAIAPGITAPLEQTMETAFLNNPEAAFAIYQLKQEDETRDLRFEPFAKLAQAGKTVDSAHYELRYTDSLPLTDSTEPTDCLNHLYTLFNLQRPPDFKGHSLSVSDVVALKQAGTVSYFYVDRFGFEQLPDFKVHSPLKTAEMTLEDDYNMIDGIINNGKHPALAATEEKRPQERERPSVVKKLRNQPINETKPAAIKRREMER